MINTLHIITGALLLVTSSISAFQAPLLVQQAGSQASKRILSSECTNNLNQRIASSILHESLDDTDDSSGYEIRAKNTDGSSPRPQTTFGAENVPVDQRPSNEYLNLIQQPTFNWASQDSGDIGLGIRLAVIYVALFALVCYPISGATYVNDGFELQKLTSSNVGAISVIFVLVLRLYSGWGYIGSRYVQLSG